jgi:hypothetical protein
MHKAAGEARCMHLGRLGFDPGASPSRLVISCGQDPPVAKDSPLPKTMPSQLRAARTTGKLTLPKQTHTSV